MCIRDRPIARRAAASGQPLLLVEGYLDVIACAQAGFTGALAPMGTAVTPDQIASLWGMIPDFTKVPILCFDGDKAGRKAAERVCDRILPLLEPGRSVRFAFLPDSEDPDSLIKASGRKGFENILSRALSLFDFLWYTYTNGRDFRTPESRAGLKVQLEKEISKIAHRDVQMHYKSELNQKISNTFFARKNYTQQHGYKPSIPVRPQKPRIHANLFFPRVMLATLINHPHLFTDIEDVVSECSFEHVRYESLRQKLIVTLSNENDITSDLLKKILVDSGFLKEIDDICSESVYVHASFSAPCAKSEDIEGLFLRYCHDVKSVEMKQEIRDGWKDAANEDDEERLRMLLSFQASDENG